MFGNRRAAEARTVAHPRDVWYAVTAVLLLLAIIAFCSNPGKYHEEISLGAGFAIAAIVTAPWRERRLPRILMVGLIGVLIQCATLAYWGIDPGTGDAAYDAARDANLLERRCDWFGPPIPTPEWTAVKREFEEWLGPVGERRMCRWGAVGVERARRDVLLARLAACRGLIAPWGAVAAHALLLAFGAWLVVRMRPGVRRATSAWMLATFAMELSVSNDLPFLTESPERLCANVVCLGLLVVGLALEKREKELAATMGVDFLSVKR